MSKTKQQIEQEYWLEFMVWYAQGSEYRYLYSNGRHSVQYCLIDQFWRWMSDHKVRDSTTIKDWESL